MKNRLIEKPAQRRLAELETEGQNIIDMYWEQVVSDANSLAIKHLQHRLKDVRSEQWQIFEKLYESTVVSKIIKMREPLFLNVA